MTDADDPPSPDEPANQDLPLLRRRLVLEQGWTDYDLGRMRAAGNWELLRQGAYLPAGLEVFDEQRHRWLVAASWDRLRARGDAVVSHTSAAVLHGLPGWGLDLTRVHLTRPGRSGVNSTRWVRPHRARLTDEEITEIDGVPVTTAARTVLDVARSAPFTQAVVVADAALAGGKTTPDELAAVLQIARQRRSAGGAARVIEFADGHSESVAESRSRVLFAVHGLPAPHLQVEIRDRNGLFVARVDFDFPELGTVGECDGLGKYSTLLRPGQTPGRPVSWQTRRCWCSDSGPRSPGRGSRGGRRQPRGWCSAVGPHDRRDHGADSAPAGHDGRNKG